MLLLVLLFFYDIFFVFGTDIMLTVAKGIDAPIKLMFPIDMTKDPPQYNILGLGDIVLPGVFMSMCLRFDFLKTLDVEKLKEMKENHGKTHKKEILGFLNFKAKDAPKHYMFSVFFGYLLGMVATILVMLIFDHGQPALLYLVPGTILAVLICSVIKGEFNLMWNFNEEDYTLKPKEEGEKKDK